MTTTTALLTAEQFRLLPDDGVPRELVRGRVIQMSLPSPRHGYYCGNVAGILRDHVKSRKLGRVVTNDAGVITERDPDTVRGPDVAYRRACHSPEVQANSPQIERRGSRRRWLFRHRRGAREGASDGSGRGIAQRDPDRR